MNDHAGDCRQQPDPRLSQVAKQREFPNSRPRDAATMIIVDAKGRSPRVLMGRRHQGHAFLPGLFVFPGGRINPADHRVPASDDLHPTVREKLCRSVKGRPAPTRPRALALTAIRETFEETGVLIGERVSAAPTSRSPDWQAFFERGVVPRLGPLRLIARAITPPRRARRYDARFFCVSAEEIALEAQPRDDELLERRWFTLDEAQALELPIITRIVLQDLAERLASGGLPALDAPVPFYAMRYGRMERSFI